MEREPPAPPILCQAADCDAVADWLCDVKIEGRRLRWYYVCAVHLERDFAPWLPKKLPTRV